MSYFSSYKWPYYHFLQLICCLFVYFCQPELIKVNLYLWLIIINRWNSLVTFHKEAILLSLNLTCRLATMNPPCCLTQTSCHWHGFEKVCTLFITAVTVFSIFINSVLICFRHYFMFDFLFWFVRSHWAHQSSVMASHS